MGLQQGSQVIDPIDLAASSASSAVMPSLAILSATSHLTQTNCLRNRFVHRRDKFAGGGEAEELLDILDGWG